jgi:hypothetical protein
VDNAVDAAVVERQKDVQVTAGRRHQPGPHQPFGNLPGRQVAYPRRIGARCVVGQDGPSI